MLFVSNVFKCSSISKAIQVHPIPYARHSTMTAELPDVIVRLSWQYRFMIVAGYPKIVSIKLWAEVILEITLTTVDDWGVTIIGLAKLAESLQRELYLISAHALGSVILHIHHRQEVLLVLVIHCPKVLKLQGGRCFGEEMVGANWYLMLSGIVNVALIPRIFYVGSLRGFHEDELQSLNVTQFIPMDSTLVT